MSGSGFFRDVGPIFQVFRNFMRGRSWNEQLRRPQNLSPRPYPQPDLPDGSSAKTSNNYYLTRDARRMVRPNLQIIDNTTTQLTSGEVKTSGSKSAPKPGDTYNWDQL